MLSWLPPDHWCLDSSASLNSEKHRIVFYLQKLNPLRVFILARVCPDSFDRSLTAWLIDNESLISVDHMYSWYESPRDDMFGTTATGRLGLAINMWLIRGQPAAQWACLLQGMHYIEPSLYGSTPEPLLDSLLCWCEHSTPSGSLTQTRCLLALAEQPIKVYGRLQMESNVSRLPDTETGSC